MDKDLLKSGDHCKFKGIPCVVKGYRVGGQDTKELMPVRPQDNLGNGCGLPRIVTDHVAQFITEHRPPAGEKLHRQHSAALAKANGTYDPPSEAMTDKITPLTGKGLETIAPNYSQLPPEWMKAIKAATEVQNRQPKYPHLDIFKPWDSHQSLNNLLAIIRQTSTNQ